MYTYIYLLIVVIGYCNSGHGYPELLFANRKDIRMIEVGRGRQTHQVIVKDVEDAACVDYYYAGRLVCWTDIDNELIKCVQVNTTAGGIKDLKEVMVISRGIVSPDGLAVDWLGEKVYWTDSDTNRIEVAGLYSSHRRVLFWHHLDQPRAIALVPVEGLMFWTDWGENPKIERAGMNGDPDTRRVIVNDDISWPNGLTVDSNQRVIYWADAKLSYIASVDFDGNRRIKVVKGKLPHPFALTYFNYTLYWTDWETRAIHYCNIDDGRRCQEQYKLGTNLSPMYLHVYDEARQPPADTPCQQNNGGCSHLCLAAPYPVNYSCACPTGVKLIDKFTCATGPEEMLLLARRTDLRRISLDTPDHTAVVVPVAEVRHAVAVDFDTTQGFMYWTDDEMHCIQRARLDGSEQEVVVRAEVFNPDGVAVDWVAGNLYWTDTGPDRIEVARLNGTSRKILITENLDEPRAITVDPDGGLMFWTDWGGEPKIESSALDGSQRHVMVSTDLGWPNGVVVDTDLRKLYWCDAKMDRIEMASLDGSERRVVLNDRLPHVFGFSLLGDHLYWTDWQLRSIERINKHTGTERSVIVEQLPDLMGLKAVSMKQVPGHHNPCHYNNGGCSHLCLNRPSNHTCGCPIGYELTQNERECVVPEAFLLYTRKEDIRRISLLTSHNVPIPITGIQEAVSIDFDSIDNRLYWTDVSVKSISRAFLNGSGMEAVVEFGLSFPDGMAVDWLARNIYWADMGNNRIEVAKLDGSSRRVLLWQNIASPKSLALDPGHGFMYWSEWGEEPSISRALLDASQPVVLVSKTGRANGLTIDFKDRRLYWTDIDNLSIESSDLNGYNRQVIVGDLPQPYGLTLYEDYVYWADWKTGTIERANKTKGENRTRIQSQLDFITDILVFHSSRQSGQSPCSNNNGGCSHLCLAVPAGTNNTHNYTCSCPTHYTLATDNSTCLPPSSFLLYSQKTEISRLVVGGIGEECPTLILPLHNLRQLRSLDYDPVDQLVYWIDGRSHTIRRAHHNGSQARTFVSSDLGKIFPVDLALDPFTRVLLWSCSKTNVINVTRLDGAQVGSIVGEGGEDKPRSLAVHPLLGLVFFINMVSMPAIERAHLDGFYRSRVVTHGLSAPSALTVDVHDDFIFWADTATKIIETATIDGDDRKVLVEGVEIVVGLAVEGELLYWVDQGLNMIVRVNKFTGQQREQVQGRVPYLSDIISVTPFLAQKMKVHPCHNGSECSHLCLERDQQRVCACPQGKTLADDRKTCINPPSCQPQEFRCHSGSVDCIPVKWRCDGQSECEDNSDELNCQLPLCQPSQFRCTNSHCIDKSEVCDGKQQCIDGSDEVQCCGVGEVMCVSTGRCVDTAQHCAGGRRPCPDNPDLAMCYTWVTDPPSVSGSHGKAPYIVGVVASVVVLVCVAALVVYYRRRPATLDDHELEQPQPKPPQARMVSWGKNYTAIPVQGDSIHGDPHISVIVGGAQAHAICRGVNPGALARGVFEPAPVTGASSSSSSMTHYPKETLNPPPTPVAEGRGRCQEPHCCYTAAHHPPQPSSSALHSYRHYKTRNRPPPPTPCSTDVCDSDVYSSAMSPGRAHCYTPTTTYNSSPPITDYDSDPHPPPPTPQMPYLCELTSCPPTSCPPSPSTERSYCTRAPCPPPPSPIVSD